MSIRIVGGFPHSGPFCGKTTTPEGQAVKIAHTPAIFGSKQIREKKAKAMPPKSSLQIISSLALVQAGLQAALLSWQLAGLADLPALAAQQAASPAIHGAKGNAGDGESQPEAPKRDWSAPVLATLAKEYKDNPDDVTFGKYFTYLRDMLVAADFAQANPAEIIAANPSLSDLHVKVSDAGVKNMHLWSFPSQSECHAVIFASPGKTTTIPLPLSIVFREGRIIPSSYSAPAAAGAASRVVVKVKGKKGQILKVVKTVHLAKTARAAASAGAASTPALSAFGKFLVLIGGDRQTNGLWLKGYRIGDGPLAEAPELFTSLPLFFSQNVSGKATFSGSDIVLTIQPPAGPQSTKDAEEKPDVVIQSNGKALPVKPTNSAVAGYKVMLKYMGGKFALAGHLPDDAPLGVALAFCQNICAGRSDVAKGWLIDPKLVSIPKYLGLVGRATPMMRLVAMSGASGARYRLVTSAKDDLIIDVGRITTPGKMKGQLAVKGLFIAPPDPYAAKLAGTPVMPQESDKPAEADDSAGGDSSAKSAPRAGAKTNAGAGTKAGTKSGGKTAGKAR
jgi:hypothetical protein